MASVLIDCTLLLNYYRSVTTTITATTTTAMVLLVIIICLLLLRGWYLTSLYLSITHSCAPDCIMTPLTTTINEGTRLQPDLLLVNILMKVNRHTPTLPALQEWC